MNIFKNLYDWRVNPSIPKYEADTMVFTGILPGTSSFSQMKEKLNERYFDKIVGKKITRGSADTFGYVQENSSVQQCYYAEVCALDMLYPGTTLINKLIEHNAIGVIRVKQEHYTLIKDAERLLKIREPDITKTAANISFLVSIAFSYLANNFFF